MSGYINSKDRSVRLLNDESFRTLASMDRIYRELIPFGDVEIHRLPFAPKYGVCHFFEGEETARVNLPKITNADIGKPMSFYNNSPTGEYLILYCANGDTIKYSPSSTINSGEYRLIQAVKLNFWIPLI
jgi:hypothetical protein